jgi:hypothetical protein
MIPHLSLLFCQDLSSSLALFLGGTGVFGRGTSATFQCVRLPRKNLSTEQVCQAEAVNFSIAFGPRPNTPVPTPKTVQGCCLSPVSLFPLLQWIAGCEV